jgi:hypothetical protein
LPSANALPIAGIANFNSLPIQLPVLPIHPIQFPASGAEYGWGQEPHRALFSFYPFYCVNIVDAARLEFTGYPMAMLILWVRSEIRNRLVTIQSRGTKARHGMRRSFRRAGAPVACCHSPRTGQRSADHCALNLQTLAIERATCCIPDEISV